ncbi:MAG TPA: dihydrofolate reductase family protein [Candidatus Acidoferrum sp.]|nr:dihydrofolate reductase family protein [Candidatus Acidoferrum sp.]
METIRKLFAAPETESGCRLQDELRTLYDGNICFPAPRADRPHTIANFVSTLDGVVSFNLPGQSQGAQISGSNEADQFTMGLLRASVDAVIVGLGTFEVAGHDTLWFPESAYRKAADSYREYRKDFLKKPEPPLLVIVTGNAQVDLSFRAFHTPGQRVVILTTEKGKKTIEARKQRDLSSVEVVALAPDGPLSPVAIVKLLRQEYQTGLLLNEGGPTLFGQFLADGVVDELFLTVSPQIAGRGPNDKRLALVEGTEFSPEKSPWWKLQSARQAGNHLFLRYQINGT